MAKKQSKSVSTLKTQKNEATQSKLPSRTCKANAAIPVVATKQDKPVTKISKKSVIKEGPKTPKAKPLPNNVPDSNKSNERVKKTGKLSSTPSSSKVLSKIAKKTPKQSSTASKNANVSKKTPLLSKRTTAIKAIKTNDYSVLGGRKASMEKKIGQNAKKYKKNIDKTVEVSQISEESESLGPVSTPAAPVSVSGDNVKTANILLQPAAKAGCGKPRGKKIPAGKTSATTRVTRTQQISQSNSTLSQDLQVNESISSGKNTIQAGRHIEVNSVKPLKRKTSNASEITSPSKKVLKITCESVANSNEMKDSGVALITGEITPTSMSVSDSLFQDSCPPEPSSNALSKVGRASIFNLSSISATKSPIIRTRKVNPKYLDSAVIPSTFSFMKNTIEQGKTTPGSTGPAKLSVSVPTPRILAKDITHRNVVTTLEESSNTSEQEVSEVTRPSKPMLGDRRQKKLLKTTLSKVDLNSNVSNASKSEHSEINSPRNIEKTLKKTTVKKTVNSLKGKKAGSETNNKVEVLESVNSVIRKKTASKSSTKAKVVEGSTISESSRGSINNKVNDAVEESPGTIVKLSQFPIKLAVFRSPSQSTSLEDTTFKPKIINAENSVVEQPRLSKRKLLALALREGKLKKVVNTKTVEKPDVKFNVPVLIKSRNVVLENSHAIPSSAKSKLHPPPSTSESALAESNSTLMKKPIWAHAISPSKKAKRLSSTRSVKPVVQKSSTVFEFSFNSEEEVREKKVVKPKRGRPPKPKVIQKNFKPLSTKTKILTTDPNFEKEFPYLGKSSHSKAGNLQASESCLVPPLDDDIHAEFECYDANIDNLEPDLRPQDKDAGQVINPSSGSTGPETGSDSAVQGLSATSFNDEAHLSDPGSEVNFAVQNPIKNMNPQQAENLSVNSKKTLPTPDATRLMSKLVGGTSTPFPASLTSAPAASISAIPINLAASKNSHRRDERREPETVSDQIKVCFGFDESDNDEAESCGYEPASFNLSPVRREQGSFWPPSHYSSMLSEAEDGIPRAHHSVTDNRSMKSNVSSCGTFLKPPVVRRTCVPARLTAATSGLAAKVTSSVSQRPVAPISNPSRQISALSSHIEGNSITTETNASANAIESRNFEKDPSSTKNHNVVKTAKIKSKDRENGGFSSNIGVDATSNTAGLEESRLFDEEDLSPAKEASPVKATAENAAASTVVSPEKSFSEPVRRAYDRRSLETSRRSLLVSLAGGPPDDDEDNMADQEDVSSASVTRRRKRKTAATDAKTRPMKALKSRSAKQPAIGKSRAEAEVDSTLEESVALPSVKLPKKSTLKSATRTLSSRTKAKKRPSDDSDKGHTNKKVKPDSILSTDKKTGTGKSVAFETSSDQSGASFGDSSNASANSAHGKKHKRPTKAAAFEKSLNDWASDLNSHFSEVEDLELVVA